MTPSMQGWQNDLESVGRVEIKSSFTSLIWRVGMAVAIVAVVIILRYQAGDIGERGLMIAVAGFAVLIVGCIVFVKVKWGDSSITIERDSIVTMDGGRIPWTDITDVSVYNAPRSGTALQVNLTEQAWTEHMSKQHRGGKMMHGANKLITRNRGLIQPEYLDARPAELAAWMNQFVRGEHTAEESEVS